jgi:gliding motility-associated-like protein
LSPLVCLQKKTFVKTFGLRANTHGYVIAYERCCRNAASVNVAAPGDKGATYFCKIPPTGITNNSAVFKNYPPQILCIHSPFTFDISSTDADGDSLTYGFCAPLLGANDADIKPIPYYPVLNDSMNYLPPFTSQYPINGSPAFSINPATGLMTGTPDIIGRYLIAVYCNEWRSGVLINTVRRDFEFLVTGCIPVPYKPDAGNDTTILVGNSAQLHGTNAVSYSWEPGTYLDDPAIADPTGDFPVAGDFQYVLHGVSDSSCTGTDTMVVHVLNVSTFRVPNAFTPNGDGVNDYLAPLPVLGSKLINFKIYNRLGDVVYNSGPDNWGWDGTYNGKKQDIGTYIWVVTFLDNTGATKYVKGNVTLLR